MSDDLTFAEMMDVATDKIEDEYEEYNGTPPNHSIRMLAVRAADVLDVSTSVDVGGADEDVEAFTDEEEREVITESIIDVLLTIGAVKYEYNLDIESAFREQMEQIEAYIESDSMEEFLEETMTEEELEELMDGVDTGDNVDDDEYDPDGVDRSYA